MDRDEYVNFNFQRIVIIGSRFLLYWLECYVIETYLNNWESLSEFLNFFFTYMIYFYREHPIFISIKYVVSARIEFLFFLVSNFFHLDFTSSHDYFCVFLQIPLVVCMQIDWRTQPKASDFEVPFCFGILVEGWVTHHDSWIMQIDQVVFFSRYPRHHSFLDCVNWQLWVTQQYK